MGPVKIYELGEYTSEEKMILRETNEVYVIWSTYVKVIKVYP